MEKKVIVLSGLVFALLAFSLVVTLIESGVFTGLTGITGGATGVAKVTVLCFVALSLPQSVVDFGGVFPGVTDNTTDDSPAPLLLQNDGGARVNVTIERDSSSFPLFSGTGGGDNTTSFQFKADQSNESGSFDMSQSVMVFTPVPGTTPVLAIARLNFSDAHDSAEVDLLIAVPFDEPPGEKQEALNLIALVTDDSCPSEGGFATICHIPPGEPDNPQTITIPQSAVPAHQAHGDTLGSCS